MGVIGVADDPLGYRSLPDALTDRLRRAIINGELGQGERLIEQDLARTFQVSRSTVRHALLRLETEHLVEVRPRRGAVVVRMSQAAASEVNEARALLEAEAARDLAGRLGDEERRSMADAAQAMADALGAHDVMRLVELDVAFHTVIARHCHNPRMFALWRSMDAEIGALLTSTLEMRRLSPASVTARHLELLQAIATGPADAAARAVRVHYVDIWPEDP